MTIVMKTIDYQISAGEFKAKCLKIMDSVKEKHISIAITKHGKPVAMLVPIEDKPIEYFGCLKNTLTIKEDITKPIDTEWDANE